jgi:hypothetical protein
MWSQRYRDINKVRINNMSISIDFFKKKEINHQSKVKERLKYSKVNKRRYTNGKHNDKR